MAITTVRGRRHERPSGTFLRLTAFAATIVGVAGLQGCYEPYPYYPPPAPVVTTVPASFDASWRAARGAANDEGVRVTYEDQAAGLIRGDKGSFAVTITVARQANGSVQVAFNVVGPTAEDPTLQDRLTRAYQRRMGR